MAELPVIRDELKTAKLVASDKLAWLSHVSGIDHKNIRVLRVKHDEIRLEKIRELEKRNETRKEGYITLAEAHELDIHVLSEGLNILCDEISGDYVGRVNYR